MGWNVWDEVDPAVPLQPELGSEGRSGGGEGGFPLARPPRCQHQGAQCRTDRGSRQVGGNFKRLIFGFLRFGETFSKEPAESLHNLKSRQVWRQVRFLGGTFLACQRTKLEIVIRHLKN